MGRRTMLPKLGIHAGYHFSLLYKRNGRLLGCSRTLVGSFHISSLHTLPISSVSISVDCLVVCTVRIVHEEEDSVDCDEWH